MQLEDVSHNGGASPAEVPRQRLPGLGQHVTARLVRFCTTPQGFIGLEVLFIIGGFLAAITLTPLLEDRRRPVKQVSSTWGHLADCEYCCVATLEPGPLLQLPGNRAGVERMIALLWAQQWVGTSLQTVTEWSGSWTHPQPGTEALCWCRAALNAGSHRCVAQAVLLYYWRRAARIAPAHWASLLLAYLTVLRGRDQIPVPEAVGALLHYEEESCPCETGIPRPCLGAR